MNVHKKENDAVAAEKIGNDQKGKKPKKGKKKAGERWRRLLRYTRVKVSEEIIESVGGSEGEESDEGQEEFLDSDSEGEDGVGDGVGDGKADYENDGKFFWEKDVKVDVPPKRSVSCKSFTSLKKSRRNDRLKMALNFQKK